MAVPQSAQGQEFLSREAGADIRYLDRDGRPVGRRRRGGACCDKARFFRPQFGCMMRSMRDPFCARCREIIWGKLA